MATYFRIKEITAPATVLRQGNLLSLDLGDFIYPEEVDTLVCINTVIYWDDNTGECFECTPKNTSVTTPTIIEPSAEVVPAPLKAGSEDTKA